jgi:cobalt-zinc-cadmium efflux system membrane fusion protein
VRSIRFWHVCNCAPQWGKHNSARGLAVVVVAALLCTTPISVNQARDSADIILRFTERQIRAAGISTVPVAQQRAELELSFPGTVIIPPHQVRVVAAPADGMVESMLLAVDEQVKEGQPIGRLRSPDLIEAQRQYLAAVADEALAADRLRRSQYLFDVRATPERELRVAETQVANAKSQLAEREQILRLMEMSEQEVESLRTTRKLIPSVTIHAPVSGTVIKRHVSPGERVAPAAPIYSIAELNPVWVNIQVPAARLAAIEPGGMVFLPAYGVEGRVIRIARTVDAQTQSANAVAEIDSNGGNVRPGLAVSAIIRIPQPSGAQWALPPASVVRHNDRAWVFVKVADGFSVRPAKVVAEGSGRISVLAELSPNDQVADRGIIALLAEFASAAKE